MVLKKNEVDYIYLDQNLIQYDFENKIELKKDSRCVWVYSDEHFNEINRMNDERFFEVLIRLKARKITMIRTDKYELTDEFQLEKFDDPLKLYDQHNETIKKYGEVTKLFNPIQTLLHGNKASYDPNAFALHFSETLKELTKEFSSDDNSQELNENIDSLSEHFSNVINKASAQVKPLEQTRKQLTKRQLSDIDDSEGNIVDKIWGEVSEKFPQFTKEQFFGKDTCPYSDPNNTGKKQLVFLGIVRCHAMLNFLGYWPDEGLPKPSKIFGINSDASHIAHSFFCSGIISADNRLCKKASAIYEYFGKINNVIHVIID